MTKYLGEPSLKEELTKHKKALKLAEEEILLLRTNLQIAETNEKHHRGLIDHSLDMIMRFAPDFAHVYSSGLKEALLKIPTNQLGEKSTQEFDNKEPEQKLLETEIKYKVLSINLQDKLQELSLSNFKLNEANQKLKEAETELRQLNFAKDRLFSIFSHDMKNPIAAIWTSCELLLKYLENENIALAKSKGEKIMEGIDQINRMINDLLQWSMMQLGLISFNPETIDFNDISKDCLAQISIQAGLKNIELKYEGSTDLKMSADPRMLSIIIGNLLSNAVKFTESGGTIILSANKNDMSFNIQVKDSGIGISPERIKTLFDVNEKKSSAGTQNEEGTGLGLLLCKDFVKQHQGDIKVDSEIGKGTIFTLSLPA